MISITENSTFIISIKNIILSGDNPSKSKVLEFKRYTLGDPIIDIGREGDPSVNVEYSIFKMSSDRISNGTISQNLSIPISFVSKEIDRDENRF